jgi:hypothetical protein
VPSAVAKETLEKVLKAPCAYWPRCGAIYLLDGHMLPTISWLEVPMSISLCDYNHGT